MSTDCRRNSTRQPHTSINRPPSTSPIAGDAAATMAQYPMALARRSGGYSELMSAMDVGPVAAPITWVRVRQAMSEPASHAVAVRAVVTVASAKPTRKTRRCP